MSEYDEERKLQPWSARRRQAQRTLKFLDCRVTGEFGTFSAMVVDVSRSGALVRVLDSGFADHAELNELMLYTARVNYHFESGIAIEFIGNEVQRASDIVRVAAYGGAGSGIKLIGIRFRDDLEPDDCARLGIAHADDSTPVGPLAREAKRQWVQAASRTAVG